MLTADVRTRIEPSLKRDAIAALKGTGLDLSTAIRLFLRSTVQHGGLPIEIPHPSNTVPRDVTALRLARAQKLRASLPAGAVFSAENIAQFREEGRSKGNGTS